MTSGMQNLAGAGAEVHRPISDIGGSGLIAKRTDHDGNPIGPLQDGEVT
jgi:predicted enzyme related to lactoylglutathione lyase